MSALATLPGHAASCRGCPACSERWALRLKHGDDTIEQFEARWQRHLVGASSQRVLRCATADPGAEVPAPPSLAARIRAARADRRTRGERLAAVMRPVAPPTAPSAPRTAQAAQTVKAEDLLTRRILEGRK